MRGSDIAATGKAKHVLVVKIMQAQIRVFGVIPAHIRVADEALTTRFQLQADLENVGNIPEPLGLWSAVHNEDGDGQTINRCLGA